jgi:hypothetical protein
MTSLFKQREVALGKVSESWLRQHEVPVSLNRYSARRDKNEAKIVTALKQLGCSIERVDCIDLMVLTPDRKVLLLEIKTPESKKRLTKMQQHLIAEGWPIHIISNIDEAVALIQKER